MSESEWYHVGYYVRRVNGELVLVQSLVTVNEDGDDADALTLYLDLDELEPAWLESLHEQGFELAEGKSCEFIPPEDEDEFDDEDEEEWEEDTDWSAWEDEEG
jgi:hypothetical protein